MTTGVRERLRRLCSENLYFWCYAGFLAGYFLFPQPPEHYRYYYVLVFLPLVAGCVKGLRQVSANALFGLLAAYLVYMVMTGLWSEGFRWAEFARVAWYGALVAVFVLASAVLRSADPARFDALLRALVLLAALTGLVSMLVWYAANPFPASRLQAISRMDHEILAGCAYGFFALLALHFVRFEHRPLWRAGLFAALLLLVATVLLTQSRTALVALVAASLLLAGLKGRVVMLAVTAAVAIALALQPELWQGLTRSMPYRLDIWSVALQRASQHWLFGTGYLSDTTVDVLGMSFVHAHSAYLATFRDGGVIGLALMLALFGAALLAALRLDRGNGHVFHVALLLYGLVCAVPDLDRILTRPRELWLFLWLPVALILADTQRRRLLSTRAPQAPSSALT